MTYTTDLRTWKKRKTILAGGTTDGTEDLDASRQI